jgi:hypothetical protein
MSKFKTFTIGFIMGSLLVGGVTFASNKHLIEVEFPIISYLINGVEMKPYPDESVPTTIRYQGFNYVPVRFIAEALNHEIAWDPGKKQIQVAESANQKFETVNIDTADSYIQKWAEASYHKEMVQMRTIGNHTYILITRGIKSTGGYNIEIQSVKQHTDGTVVNVKYVNPPKGALLVEQMTYPYKLIKLPNASIDHVQVREINGEFIPHLLGINYIPTRIDETENIILFEPARTEDSVILRGAVRTFEGVIGYVELGSDLEAVKEGTILAAGAAPNWAYFEEKISKDRLSSISSLQIYTLNAKDGSKHEIISLSANDL